MSSVVFVLPFAIKYETYCLTSQLFNKLFDYSVGVCVRLLECVCKTARECVCKTMFM